MSTRHSTRIASSILIAMTMFAFSCTHSVTKEQRHRILHRTD